MYLLTRNFQEHPVQEHAMRVDLGFACNLTTQTYDVLNSSIPQPYLDYHRHCCKHQLHSCHHYHSSCLHLVAHVRCLLSLQSYNGLVNILNKKVK